MKVLLEEVSVERGGRLILKDVTATLTPGGLTCVLGANGAGKTTLFQTITGQVRPVRGRVSILQSDGTPLPPREMARRLAVLPQGLQDPPHLTVREVVALGRFRPGNGLGWRSSESDHARVEEVLSHCGISHMKERRFEDLSGGEKQRAWLAFCLAQDKDFLVLDESLDGLDFFAKRAFFELLAELAARDRGVLLATHEMELAGRFAARLLVLEDGRLCYDGLPRDDLLSLFSPDRRALAHA